MESSERLFDYWRVFGRLNKKLEIYGGHSAVMIRAKFTKSAVLWDCLLSNMLLMVC